MNIRSTIMINKVYTIPIKVNNYEELFSELDYRNLDQRELNEDVDNFIDMSILRTNEKIKNMEFQLIIHLPEEIKDHNKEAMVEKGLKNHYNSVFEYQKKIKRLSIRRIIYYGISALILLVMWYYIVTYKSEGFLTSLLNAGGTVLLWEIMSLVLIERKNSQDRARMNRKLYNMKIVFKYIE